MAGVAARVWDRVQARAAWVILAVLGALAFFGRAFLASWLTRRDPHVAAPLPNVPEAQRPARDAQVREADAVLERARSEADTVPDKPIADIVADAERRQAARRARRGQ